nr:MAG TPA: hypothetical protein [Caudoviricetes sp.]
MSPRSDTILRSQLSPITQTRVIGFCAFFTVPIMRRLLSTRKEPPCSSRPSSPSSVLLSSLHLPCSTTHACSAEAPRLHIRV